MKNVVIFAMVVAFLIGLLGMTSVNAQQLAPFIAMQVSRSKERIRTGIWFPIFLSLTTNDAKDEEFAFTGSTRDRESMAFQGLGLKAKVGSVGIKKLKQIQLAAIGIDEKGEENKENQKQKDLSAIPEKAWHDLSYQGGVMFGAAEIKTDKMSIGGNVLAIRVKHDDDKDWTYFLVFESCKDVPGELQTAYVIYIQKAPDGYDAQTWTPEEKFFYTRGFTFYKASSSDPDKSKELAYARLPKLSDPCIFPNGGNYVGSVRVAIGVQVKDAIVHVTCDGSEPTMKSPICANDMVLNKPCVLKAKAFIRGYQDSETVSAEFVITPPLPPKATRPEIILLTADKRGYGQVGVTITSRQGGVIRLTVDGTEPTEASAQYVGQFGMDANGIVKAKVFVDGFSPSDMVCADVTIKQPPPTPKADQPIINASSIGSSVCVAMISITPRAIIRYTMDGSEPYENSPVYAGVITVRKTTTLKVRVYADGYLPSDTETRTYQVGNPACDKQPESPRSTPPPDRCNETEEVCEYGIVDIDLIGESNGFETKAHGSDANSKGRVFATVLGGLKNTVDFCDRQNVFSFDHLIGITLTKVPCGVLSIHFLDESEATAWHIRKDLSDNCYSVAIVEGRRCVRWHIKPGQRTHITLERGK